MEPRITDKKTIGEKFGNKNLFNKKPPTNTKYKDVAKTIDTGKTINDVQVLSDQFVSKRKNELFKRIKPSTIVKLIEENTNTESIYNLAEENNEENIYNNLKNNINNDNITTTSVVLPDNVSQYTGKTDMTKKTTVTAITFATEMLGNLSQLDFILLDLREKTEYDNYHIKEARSYPGPNISRDKYSQEMYSLKNKDNKLIILYGADERSSIPYATLLLQKGFDNIYLLSGGIEEFVKLYPEHCEGPEVQKLINQKIQEDILKKDALLKSSKSKFNGTKASLKDVKPGKTNNQNNRAISVDMVKTTNTSVKSGVPSVSNKSTINNLKKNLQK